MGRVFEAEHVRLGTRVALKMLRPELVTERRVVERFKREASLLGGLCAENVVRVFDCGEDESGNPFFVMERLQGEDLRTAIEREAPLPLKRALHVALDVCRGLAALHASGVVHRDVKPANLFLVRDAFGREVCKILDLGVARIAAADATGQGAPIGTLRYMAPEQLTDSARVGPAADVYAAGAVLYECVTGHPPHTSTNVEQLMFDIINRAPESPALARPGVSDALSQLIMDALSRSPEHRPASVAEMAGAIQRILRGASRAPDPQARTLAEHVSVKPPRRKLNWSLAAAAGVLVALAAGASMGLQISPASQATAARAPAPVDVRPVGSSLRAAPLSPRAAENPLGPARGDATSTSEVAPLVPRAADSGSARAASQKAPLPRRNQRAHVLSTSDPARPFLVDIDAQNPYAE
jgi:serine/threonine-protein kinase